MNAFRRMMSIVILISIASVGLTAQLRSYPQQGAGQSDWRAQRQLIARIEDRADLLRSNLDVNSGRSRVYDRSSGDDASGLFPTFDGAVQRLHEQINQRT